MDIVSKSTRSRMMAGIRGKNTRPENGGASLASCRRVPVSAHDRHLPGVPDLVLRRYHAVILVHGCFWHGHSACPFAATPKSPWTSTQNCAMPRTSRRGSNYCSTTAEPSSLPPDRPQKLLTICVLSLCRLRVSVSWGHWSLRVVLVVEFIFFDCTRRIIPRVF